MLRICDISKKYSNGYWGIKNFSLEVKDGEIVCLAGPNGAGKTTLINSIFGVIKPTSGKVYCGDLDSNSYEFKKNVVYIPDDLLLIDELTGKEYIDFVKNIYLDVKVDLIEQLIELFEMEAYINEPIKTYSHGMKKKIQIITAFMVKSKVIVMDEPFRGLDVETTIILKKLIKQYAALGGSVIIASHDLVSAEKMCDRMAIVSNGHLMDVGTVDYLKKKYESEDIDEVFLKCALKDNRGDDIEKVINAL